MPAETITRSVADKVKEAKPGTVFFPADLLEFGAPDAIHQTFSRLAKNKTLLRLAKGIYVKPTMDPELGALRPSLENVAQQIAERDKVVIRPTGAGGEQADAKKCSPKTRPRAAAGARPCRNYRWSQPPSHCPTPPNPPACGPGWASGRMCCS